MTTATTIATTSDTGSVRTVQAADYPQVAAAMSSGFYDDPVFRWIYPDADRRRRVLPGYFSVVTEAIARHGRSLVTTDGAGAALWLSPGQQMVDDDEVEIFEAELAALSPVDAGRLEACFAVMEEHHPHEPCWYLNLLAVAAGHQGRGLGSTMLAAASERSDRDRMASYLEATSPHNRRLYERHGFEVVGEMNLPDGPAMWAMWREPRG